MKIKSDCKVREIAGESVVIMQGKHSADLTKIITLNESALLMWNTLAGRDFSVEDAAQVLCDNYDVDHLTAMRDAQVWINKLAECKLLD